VSNTITPKIHNPQLDRAQKQYDKYKNVPKQYLEVAEGMEAQYINYMLNEMEKTVHKEKPDSPAEKYYKSLINAERAEIMAKTENGVGIKDVILDQILPQHMRRPTNVQQAVKQYKQNNSVSNKGVDHE
jgi:Rod binding domain-containing protein